MVDLYHLAQASQVCITTHPQGSKVKFIQQMLDQLPNPTNQVNILVG